MIWTGTTFEQVHFKVNDQTLPAFMKLPPTVAAQAKQMLAEELKERKREENNSGLLQTIFNDE